ncbi:hypothetical protein [Tautonia rosea]|uniref:hypothetical protein n=1 Tax=Tautonia rosea TaxID=2728037 RepID=UPI001474EB18|nr:hypothetical protein [Tautonia rosea]
MGYAFTCLVAPIPVERLQEELSRIPFAEGVDVIRISLNRSMAVAGNRISAETLDWVSRAARALSQKVGPIVAMRWDDRVGDRAADLLENGLVVHSFGPDDEDEESDDEDEESLANAIDLALAQAGFDDLGGAAGVVSFACLARPFGRLESRPQD